MKVMIPKSVDVQGMINGLYLSPTRRENLKNKIYYFLSLLVLTNDNYALNNKNKGYRKISSVRMKKTMGRKDYHLIIQILSNPLDPVIKSDGSWRSSDLGGIAYPKGYRLCQKYNTGEIEWKTIPEKFSNRINKHLRKDPVENFDDSKYQFLYDQFTVNKLSIDPIVKDYIYSLGQQLLARVDNNNEYQTNMILNLIGRWLYYIQKIENDDIWRQVSPANWRLNTSVTHLKRNLRPFLLCNGKKLGEIDITASQPYILSAVMNDDFISGKNENFSLQSIYPEALTKLIDASYITSTSVYNSQSFRYTSYSGSSMNADFNLDSVSSTGNIKQSYSFMWGQFFDDVELNSIKSYQGSPFNNDFYKFLLSRSSIINCQETQDEFVLRQKIKDNMKLVLFDDKKLHREGSVYIKMFREAFPGVDKFIRTFHSLIGSRGFSYLLQRAESHLILDVVCRDFHQKYPAAPIFSIHDAICTYPEYLPDLKNLLLEHSQNLISKPVGLKESIWEPDPIPNQKDVEKVWKKIRKVNTPTKYKDKSHSIFPSNIERGRKFLST